MEKKEIEIIELGLRDKENPAPTRA